MAELQDDTTAQGEPMTDFGSAPVVVSEEDAPVKPKRKPEPEDHAVADDESVDAATPEPLQRGVVIK